MELNIEARFFDETDTNGFNIIAELPGTDLAGEVVLLGAHFDTEPGATGATDNAAGCAVMMEAMRILKAVGAKPRRTIRVALWDGEESGLMGSKAYVRDHLADITTMKLKPEHEKLSAYYNVDNGTGQDSRRVDAGQPGRCSADLPAVDRAAARSRRDHPRRPRP